MPLLMIFESPKAENEKEVMVNLGTQFVIRGTNGTNEVFLEEVEQNNKIAIKLKWNFWKQEIELDRTPLTRAEKRCIEKQRILENKLPPFPLLPII